MEPSSKRLKSSDNNLTFSLDDLNGNEERTHEFLTATYLHLQSHFTEVNNRALKIWMDLAPTPNSVLSEKKIIENSDELKTYWDSSIEIIIKHVGEYSTVSLYIHTQPCMLLYIPVNSAFRSRISSGRIVNVENIVEPNVFLRQSYEWFVKYVNLALQRNSLKVNTSLVTWHRKPSTDDVDKKYFNTKNVEILATTNLAEWYDNHIIHPLMTKLSEFEGKDSGWSLDEIVELHLNINHYVPFYAGANEIRNLPKIIQNKKAVINVQSPDHACFAWSVVAALYPAELHSNRTSSYPHYNTVLNMNGVNMPLELHNLEKFEKQNNLSLNVFGAQYANSNEWICIGENCSEKCFKLLPIYISKNHHKTRHINLLMLQVGNSSEYHFSFIKNLARLVRSEVTRAHSKIYVCDRCLSYYYSSEKLNMHMTDCELFNPVRNIMPTEDNKYISFTNYNHKERVPFIIYADLECTLKPYDTCTPNTEMSYSTPVNKHEVHSIAYYLKCSFSEEHNKFQLYRGINCCQWFVEQLSEIVTFVNALYARMIPMQELSTEELEIYNSSTTCHICERELNADDKRKDHCHMTGRYRGAAHNSCNLNYQVPNYIPVVFHNLSGYDSHFLIKELCEKRELNEEGTSMYVSNQGRVSLLPINIEKYKGFTKTVQVGKHKYFRLRFIDSYNFIASSLEKSVSYLSNDVMNETRAHFSDDTHFNLIRQKGIFPYEYIKDIDVLNERNLPPIDSFFSTLNGENISQAEYNRAQCVWNTFNCQTIGDYSDVYLKSDVMILSDIFENFRHVCMDTYKLDPAHYFTAPGLAWNALLKCTHIKLELLTDIDMLHFVEKGIRGGVVHCANRHAVANNKYIANYDASTPTSYIMFMDINNLYGWAMLQNLPQGKFEWVENVENFSVEHVKDDGNVGYFLEVDLHYPEHLHDLHKDFPMCAERVKPSTESSTTPKLINTLFDKEKYIIHYRNLKQCIKYGIVVNQIHRVLKFEQSAWMKPYIEINTNKRQCATNEFEIFFYKLMNNSVFGKTIQNVRKMRDVHLLTHWEGRYGAARLIARPNFKQRVIFNENLVCIEMNKVEILFNKPIYVGTAILDISKTKLLEFHYEYMMNKYGCDQISMCYTDTDSLIYHIHTNDVYADIKNDVLSWFDTSDYDENNVYEIPRVNKKVIGLMKDEMCGKPIKQFVGLRAKMYSIECDNNVDICKSKGVKRCITKHLTINDYKKCLTQNVQLLRTQRLIRSYAHNVFTIEQQKIALSSCDDKRYVVPHSTSTLPWGHYRIAHGM